MDKFKSPAERWQEKNCSKCFKPKRCYTMFDIIACIAAKNALKLDKLLKRERARK